MENDNKYLTLSLSLPIISTTTEFRCYLKPVIFPELIIFINSHYYSAFTLTWLMTFLQTLNFHCFRWLKEKNSTWKPLTIIQVRVNELYLFSSSCAFKKRGFLLRPAWNFEANRLNLSTVPTKPSRKVVKFFRKKCKTSGKEGVKLVSWSGAEEKYLVHQILHDSNLSITRTNLCFMWTFQL